MRDALKQRSESQKGFFDGLVARYSVDMSGVEITAKGCADAALKYARLAKALVNAETDLQVAESAVSGRQAEVDTALKSLVHRVDPAT